MMSLLLGFLLLQCAVKVLSEQGSATAAPPANSTAKSVAHSATSLFSEYWQMNLMDNPEEATALGDHRYDDRLTGYSLMCYEKRKVMMTEFLERATQLESLATEGSDTYDNIQHFVAMLKYKIDRLMSGSYLFPVSKMDLPQMSLRYLQKYLDLEEAKNYWDLIARYRAFPQQIDEQIELMREGIRTNFTLNENSLWKHGGDRSNISVLDSPYFEPFLNLSANVSGEEAAHIQSNASDAVMNSIYPAIQKIDDFVENEYRLSARPGVGVGSLPGGLDFYRQELAFHLTDPGVTPEEIHAMGVAEVQRITEEMLEVIHSLGLNLTTEEFSDKLRNDKSWFFASEEEALQTYRDIIANKITPKLPLLFNIVPKKVLMVENIPADLSSGPRAYYMRASADNSTPATFFLDTSSVHNLPKYEVVTLAMHEGVPGHHFQISYSMEQKNLPDFRKYGYNSNAFLEGWALYAEYLGYELGLYEDPYMRYGHLSEEIFRACRMVVDTGIHAFGWSRQRAIDFMMRHSASTIDNVEREVDRYITWPGQACSYKYGEMKIKQLRERAESTLGERFDVRAFHDVVLRSNGPLELVERQVDSYIRKISNNEPSSDELGTTGAE